MKDLTEDSNSCSWSMHCGDKSLPYGQYQNGFSMKAIPDSYSGYERDFLKQTMLEHEAIFRNQVYELHRLYRTQKILMDEVRGKNVIDHMYQSEHTPESTIKRELPGFLLGNLVCGEGSSSQACNFPTQNGISSKDEEVVEVRPVKVMRKTIDLQLPADEYLDIDGENMSCPPYEQSKAAKEVCGKLFHERGNASNMNGFSGSSLVMKNPNRLTDLNEPAQCRESVPVCSSRDIYSLYGRNIAHMQGQWLDKNTSQNGWMVLEAGHGKSIPRDKLCQPSHSVQVLSNNAFQPLGYPSTDHRKLSGERASLKCEALQRIPEVSYDSYVESSVASNAPSFHHSHRPESARPWSHWIPSWENGSSSSVQKFLPLQTNPFLNFHTQARVDSSSEMRSHGFYQGISSRSKESAFNFPSGNFNHINDGPKGAVTNGYLSKDLKLWSPENLQGPKKLECSAGFPWIKKLNPSNKNGITSGGFDLNASAHQFMDLSDACDGSNSVAPHNGFGSVSCSNDKPKEVNTLVRKNLDINLPCKALVSEAVIVDKKEGKNAGTYCIDLNLCATEDEEYGLCSNPRVETKATTLIDLEALLILESKEAEQLPEKSEAGDSVDELIKTAAEAIVTISLSHNYCNNTDEAASSSTDAVAKNPLSWFVNTIASCGQDLDEKIDASLEARDCEGCSSGEFDYFETTTLNLPHMKEEDYMPKPLLPDYLNFDGTGSSNITANRPRRGQARRGRPRRDFQRDILPGLPSLSKLEVTEDLQMFGGLMKATGCNWNSGMARRSSNRGRKRLANNINRAPVCSSLAQPMVGLEDSSLTGWGNASRRPRRQRCPASTPPTVILT